MLKKNIKKALVSLKITLEQESESTKEMLKTYYSFSQGNVEEEELKQANKQLKTLLKDLGFGFLAILPFAPITIPLLVKLTRRYEIDIIPDWFKDSLKK
tara:strand:+ start:9435 stop:9731 length:297 start_codon:yes stop_codon:yes gene_type:complete